MRSTYAGLRESKLHSKNKHGRFCELFTFCKDENGDFLCSEARASTNSTGIMDAIVVIVFVVVTFLEWYHVGGLLSTRISPESDYDNLRGVPNAAFICE